MRAYSLTVSGSTIVSGSIEATGAISGSFKRSDIKAALPVDTVSGSAQLPVDIVSGSAQLATNISGSFTDASSSFSTRVARLETSGSITYSSASFSTRTTTLESSASILAGTGNIQGVGQSNSPTFVNVTATGTMTAQEFHTEFVSASIVYVSGSTKFGDTIDDIHSFTGSIHQSGSFNLNDGNMTVTDTLTATTLTGTTIKDFTTISGSVTSTGSFAAVNVAGMSVSNLVDVSSSFSTRVLNLKSDSGSFSTRVTDLKSDSGSFSTRVSNLKSDSGSFSTRVTDLKSDSGSFSSRVTTNEGKATKGFTIAMSVAL